MFILLSIIIHFNICMMIKYILMFLFVSSRVYAQTYSISGSIKDFKTNEALSYANIRVSNSTLGTSSNYEGEYEIRLSSGKYNLIASYIGYKTDTLTINLNSNLSGINFQLLQTDVELPEVVVRPGENPALEIIRKAIERKKERDAKIFSYEFEAYTKGILRAPEDADAEENKVSISIGETEDEKLNIAGIIENESKGFFRKPDNYKEIITARKQTANFPSSINILTGGRIMQNFYNDE
ncbi:MAG: carboxypeptidase-like regulatory domain-containing protein, partial [Ignavibacteriales bacterium]